MVNTILISPDFDTEHIMQLLIILFFLLLDYSSIAQTTTTAVSATTPSSAIHITASNVCDVDAPSRFFLVFIIRGPIYKISYDNLTIILR